MKRKINLRFVLFLLSSLVILIFFLAWLLPPEGRVVRTKTIYASKQEVAHTLTNLKTYPHWFPWIQSAPHLNIIYYGLKKNVMDGFSFEDHKDKLGFGRFELESRKGDSLFNFEFDYKDMPRMLGSYALHDMGEKQTIVVWTLSMKAGWKPWWRFFASMMNKLTSPVMDSGLVRLKKLCEDPQKPVFKY